MKAVVFTDSGTFAPAEVAFIVNVDDVDGFEALTDGERNTLALIHGDRVVPKGIALNDEKLRSGIYRVNDVLVALAGEWGIVLDDDKLDALTHHVFNVILKGSAWDDDPEEDPYP